MGCGPCLLALGGVLALLAGAAAWLALDPGLLRPAAEYLATAATGRPVVIGALDLQVVDGRTVIEARKVRVGQTTTERVSVSLAGMRSHANGDGVRFPNGSSIGHFRASIDLSLTGLPRISTVDTSGAVLVAARRSRSDRDGPPPLARLLIVPRILLGLGLERLVLHSGEIEYRGRSSTRSAGMTAVLHSTDRGLAFRGELLVGPGAPALPFDGTVRDPMDDDWQIDVRLTGDDVPMEGGPVPGPGCWSPARRFEPASDGSRTRPASSSRYGSRRPGSNRRTWTSPSAHRGKAVRQGSTSKGWASLPERFPIRAAGPSPGRWTGPDCPGERTRSRAPSPCAGRPESGGLCDGPPAGSRFRCWPGRPAMRCRPSIPSVPRWERLRPAGTIDELAAFGDPGVGDEPSFWLSAVVCRDSGPRPGGG